jgi:surface protein
MKKTNILKNLLEVNYNLKANRHEYLPETNYELQTIVNKLIDKHGNEVDLNNINVLNIRDFSVVFFDKKYFNGYVSEWNVSNGINFFGMFWWCEEFNRDLSGWDVSNGEKFNKMFEYCYKFSPNLFDWDVSNGINFTDMFYNCKSFNADLSNWDVSNAKSWFSFARYSLLEKYPERIPDKFRIDYL